MATKSKPVKWPDRIRAILERNGWTQAELARRIGITPGAVNHFTAGRGEPSRPVEMLIEQIENKR
jgi:transcriptional regulator with XRE-family HTH domain